VCAYHNRQTLQCAAGRQTYQKQSRPNDGNNFLITLFKGNHHFLALLIKRRNWPSHFCNVTLPFVLITESPNSFMHRRQWHFDKISYALKHLFRFGRGRRIRNKEFHVTRRQSRSSAYPINPGVRCASIGNYPAQACRYGRCDWLGRGLLISLGLDDAAVPPLNARSPGYRTSSARFVYELANRLTAQERAVCRNGDQYLGELAAPPMRSTAVVWFRLPAGAASATACARFRPFGAYRDIGHACPDLSFPLEVTEYPATFFSFV
jgi:hypothetical protein